MFSHQSAAVRNRRACLGVLFLALSVSAHAQITTSIVPDGTLGTTVVQTGSVYHIVGGTIIGGVSQFHSFDLFSVGTSDIASFHGPVGIENILSRVTGGQSSLIDGTIRSTISGANLFLLNPAGVVFHENAALDVSGSFHVSTADYIRFADGERFDAVADMPVLTSATPSAFGFLGTTPASVRMEGSSLALAPGETFSIVGGDVDIVAGSEVVVPGGRFNLVSVASAGEAVLTDSGVDVSSFGRLGNINIDNSEISASGLGGGDVFIRGGRLVIDNGQIRSLTTAATQGGEVSIGLTGDLSVTGPLAEIQTGTFGTGDAPDIIIEANRVIFADRAAILTDTRGSGNAGDLTLTVSTLEVLSGAIMSTSTAGGGHGGDLTVSAGSVLISGEGFPLFTGISAQAFLSSGDGGNITITTGRLEVRDGGFIDASTFGAGDAGNITITAGNLEVRDGGVIEAINGGTGEGGDVTVIADTVLLFGDSRSVFTGISAAAVGSGDGGNITITTGRLEVRDGAHIDAITLASGDGGDLTVNADTVLISGDGIPRFTGISADAAEGSSGDAGNITITAGRLEVRDGGIIDATTFGTGNGGDLTVSADTVLVSGEGSSFLTGIIAEARASDSGDGGDIKITADILEVRGGAQISASTFGQGSAGNVTVIASGDILIVGSHDSEFQSGIFSVTNGSGDGGSVTVQAGGSIIMNGGRILVRTLGDGDAGSIDVAATNLTLTDGAQIFSGIGTVQADGTVVGSPDGTGDGGDIAVTVTDTLLISGSDPEGFKSGLFTDAQIGIGNAGDISVSTNKLTLTNGSTVSASSATPGLAGDVRIEVGTVFESFNSSITTAADQSDGGNIDLRVGQLMHLVDSDINATVRLGIGTGGNITIDPEFVVLNNSQITANAFGGSGGNITIQADNFLISADSTITASSALGIAGTVVVESPENDIAGSISQLPQNYLDVATLLPSRCGARHVGVQSSFVVTGRGGVPLDPDRYLPSLNAMTSLPPGSDTASHTDAAIIAVSDIGKIQNTGVALTRFGCSR